MMIDGGSSSSSGGGGGGGVGDRDEGAIMHSES